MNNSEIHAIFGTIHRTITNKTKAQHQKQKTKYSQVRY